MKKCLFILLWFVLPTAAEAAVYISEVAWMGSSASANHEWIELHNDGDTVDVSGWVLSDGMNLSVTLEGTILENSYAVLERTSDDSAMGEAFLIYTGALVNTGAVLRLEKADGTLADQVNGGEDWSLIGGDNITKETAQYTPNGWVTAIATPGTANKELSVEPAAPKKTVLSGGKLAEPKIKPVVELSLPDVTLELDVTAPVAGYVNQPIKFTVKPSGIGDTLLDSLNYEWNFGDGSVATNQSSEHIFTYPGTYVVTLYAGYKRQEQVARHQITILPVAVLLTKNRNGDVQVNNDSPYEVNLSNYRLRADKVFQFPPRTILLPNQTITIAKDKLGDTNKLVSIYDNQGVLINSIMPTTLSSSRPVSNNEIIPPEPKVSATAASRQSMVVDTGFGFSNNRQEEEEEVFEFTEEEIQTEGNLANVVSASTAENEQWPYLALVGLLAVATVGVYIKPKRNENL